MSKEESDKTTSRVFAGHCIDPKIASLIDKGIAEVMAAESLSVQRATVRLLMYGVNSLGQAYASPELLQLIKERRAYEHIYAEYLADTKLRSVVDAVGRDKTYRIVAEHHFDRKPRY